MSLVNVSIVGNLVKAPEQTCFASGRIKTTLVVAVNSPNRLQKGSERGADTADFYKVEAWGRLGELAHKYLSKGNQVGVSGRLILDHWTDKQGKDRMTLLVEASQLSFPPRLRVVGSDGQIESCQPATNPVGGELIFAEAEDEEQAEGAPGLADSTAGRSCRSRRTANT